MIRAAAVAALLGATLATAAVATPPEPPHAGPCHVYWKASPVSGVEQPFLFCDY